MDAEARAPFVAKAVERTAAAVTVGGDGATSSAAAPKAKRAKTKAQAESDSEDDIEYAEEDAATEDVDVEEEEEEEAPAPKQQSRRREAPAEGVEDTSEWGCDRTHPVQFLLTRAGSGAYVAVRAPAGVPTLEQPVALRVMPAAAAAVDDGDSAPAPELLHSEDMEHDYEIAAAQFKAALAERTSADSIDLDDLPADSPLGSMVILEMLRSKGGPLHEQALGRGKRNVLGCPDVLVKVPAVALSFIVQRLITAAVQADRASRGCVADEAMADDGEDGGEGIPTAAGEDVE